MADSTKQVRSQPFQGCNTGSSPVSVICVYSVSYLEYICNKYCTKIIINDIQKNNIKEKLDKELSD